MTYKNKNNKNNILYFPDTPEETPAYLQAWYDVITHIMMFKNEATGKSFYSNRDRLKVLVLFGKNMASYKICIPDDNGVNIVSDIYPSEPQLTPLLRTWKDFFSQHPGRHDVIYKEKSLEITRSLITPYVELLLYPGVYRKDYEVKYIPYRFISEEYLKGTNFPILTTNIPLKKSIILNRAVKVKSRYNYYINSIIKNLLQKGVYINPENIFKAI